MKKINLINLFEEELTSQIQFSFGFEWEQLLISYRKEGEHKKSLFINLNEEGVYYSDEEGNELPEEDAIDAFAVSIAPKIVEYNHVNGKEVTILEMEKLNLHMDESMCKEKINNFINKIMELLKKHREDAKNYNLYYEDYEEA